MTASGNFLLNGARRAAYVAGQGARVLWYTGHYAVGRRAMGPLTAPGEAPYADEFSGLDRTRLKNAFRELFKADWDNIKKGIYKMPKELRTPPSPIKLWRQSRDYLRDTDKVARRKAARAHSEVLTAAVREKYPRYYLQNFHFQTGGWLTDDSAERYDMQVETIFTGAGHTMRRQSLPHIRAAIKGRDPASLKMLDLGCGAGSFLEGVKDNWPGLPVTALDLSPAYLGKARTTLAGFRNIDFVEAKAEETGLADESFDIITAIYLFHELPPAIRKEVVSEMARLIKSGGSVILTDTIQYGDEPGFDILLENFPRGFHEPYYDSYCRTDLEALFAEAGFRREEETLAFLTKITRFVKV